MLRSTPIGRSLMGPPHRPPELDRVDPCHRVRRQTVVPNAQLARQSLRILQKPGQLYAQTFTILVSGAEDPERVKSLLREAAQKCEALLPPPAPVIRLADASSIPFHYSLWVHFDGYMSSFAEREELFSSIHKAFTEAGLEVTDEVQDVRFKRERPASRL